MMPGMPVPAGKPKYSQMLVEVSPGQWEIVDQKGHAHKPTAGVLHHIGQMTAVKPYGGKMTTWGELKREGKVPDTLAKLVAPPAHARAMQELNAKPKIHLHRELAPGQLPPGMAQTNGPPPPMPPGMPGMPAAPQAEQAKPQIAGVTA